MLFATIIFLVALALSQSLDGNDERAGRNSTEKIGRMSSLDLQKFSNVRGENVPTAIIQPEGGPWGDERNWVYCRRNTWAIGFTQRVESPCGRCDDTALNAVNLICGERNGAPVETIESFGGEWGSWSDPTYCYGEHNFLRAAQFRVEPPQGRGDDTSANSVRFTCTKGNAIEASNSAPWGNWRAGAECPPESAICGIRTKFEPRQGRGDDTAMNGAKFLCCALKRH